MPITGDLLLGQSLVRGTGRALQAIDPSTGAALAEPVFASGEAEAVERACALAEAAFDPFRAAPLATRAAFLEAIAEGIAALGDALIERAHAETGLPKARLEGERGRTIGQLKLFAQIVRDGRWLDATLDSPLPERKPLPRADLRMQKIPLGPVAVFGASNFPLAFSVAGGDTASAFAAGCPVIVKAHRAHLGTSELVGRAVQAAVAQCGLPEGTFSLIHGEGGTIGAALAAHPSIKAVGFTGSRNGGLSLMRVAAARPEPIPVYAEMSSINPLFALPAALAARTDAMARGFVDSLVLGAGQFCTNPGLVIAIDGAPLAAFIEGASAALRAKAAQTMLTPGIHAAYESGLAHLQAQDGVALAARGEAGSGPSQACAALFVTDAHTFLANAALNDEVFGPASTVIRCRNADELLQVARKLEGQLTATLHLDETDAADLDLARALLPVLERKAGRVLANGYPTGVEVSYAMVHGGPFPATSDSRVTSVGASAIERFLRPVCYQDLPAALVPEALRDGNPLGVWRLQDGELTR
ncbi:aldehyde dehydrogenase (NADP(+)) [Paraburkholderia acidisoli]|uniref:Aldehyde dehydrogenase family protein n=1 Tax=Paraburkholderia acidisoli TaxID=2571748 RepID=A0A7Z2GPA3_9BURK|nr:aldehyde dehydrogenase (NADP(+)) [Paraburkholderia acidisoli]QGZ65472.1 aldehyde dehydrogenase family protein [Paraburkholderia acidisoli]